MNIFAPCSKPLLNGVAKT